MVSFLSNGGKCQNIIMLIDEFVNEEFPTFVIVFVKPLIDLLEKVIELLKVTSGAAHSRPVAVPEFAFR